MRQTLGHRAAFAALVALACVPVTGCTSRGESAPRPSASSSVSEPTTSETPRPPSARTVLDEALANLRDQDRVAFQQSLTWEGAALIGFHGNLRLSAGEASFDGFFGNPMTPEVRATARFVVARGRHLYTTNQFTGATRGCWAPFLPSRAGIRAAMPGPRFGLGGIDLLKQARPTEYLPKSQLVRGTIPLDAVAGFFGYGMELAFHHSKSRLPGVVPFVATVADGSLLHWDLLGVDLANTLHRTGTPGLREAGWLADMEFHYTISSWPGEPIRLPDPDQVAPNVDAGCADSARSA